MIQKVSEPLGMAKPKKTQRPMEENKIQNLNMTPIFIMFINRITSLQENTMYKLKKGEFSPQGD